MAEQHTAWAMLAGAVGGAVAIGIMEGFAVRIAEPLMAIPFATSIVLVMGSPEAEAAQPRALVGGHVIATLVGRAAHERQISPPRARRAGGSIRPIAGQEVDPTRTD